MSKIGISIYSNLSINCSTVIKNIRWIETVVWCMSEGKGLKSSRTMQRYGSKRRSRLVSMRKFKVEVSEAVSKQEKNLF